MRFSLVLFAALSIFGVGAPVFGCSCVQPPPGTNTAQQLAAWAANGKGAIFEGKVESVQLRWKLVEARIGDLVPADIEQEPPEMEVSFEVLRSYRGAEGKRVKVRTGLGGGDCGFDFETSEQYLVFAYQGDSGELSTGICSSTDLLGESQSKLAYLRNEPEITESNQKKSATDRAAICGQVIFDNPARMIDGQILFFKVGDKSLLPSDETELTADGSFCARDLRPAKYVLVFRDGPDESPELTFYPGVIKPSEATEVEVAPREAVSHLLFKVPGPQTYAVSGKIAAFNESKRQAEPKVMLLSAADRFVLALGYSADVTADGAFVLRQVVPGKYWAVVTVDSDGKTKWLTRKVEVNVDGDVTGLSLELSAN